MSPAEMTHPVEDASVTAVTMSAARASQAGAPGDPASAVVEAASSDPASSGRTPPRPAKKTRSSRRGRLSPRHRWMVAAMIVLPVLIVLYKVSGLPGAERVAWNLSFQMLEHGERSRMLHLLMTPIGALLVVFTRLTLGLRVLGPFRSVLLAIAFQVTGPVIGPIFFALVIAVVVLLRPSIKAMRLPYFGRSTVMLAAVAGMIVLATLLGIALGVPDVERVAYFPVVVLTLAGEAFAKTLRKEGQRSAMWRAGSTAALALVITGLSSIAVLRNGLIACPELELVVVAGIILTCEYLPFRALQHLNPPVKKRPRKSTTTVKIA